MPEAEVQTLILRFRDLATGLGQTVDLHNAITEHEGFVWWAWWSKVGEQVPEVLFRRLREGATANGLRLYLFDSGRNTLFTALCTDIEWHHTLTRRVSPDPTKTPSYYRDEQYLAWFRLEKILPEGDAALHTLTYVDLDAFFEAPLSKYKASFDGKQVSSALELQQQNRSIWFVRPFAEGDKTNVVDILDGAQLQPSHYSNQVIESSSRRLLWVSDTHFARDRAFHGFPITPTAAEFPVAQRIETALGADRTLAGVIATGDLTWRADPEEFAIAKDFFRQIGSWTRMPEHTFAVMPGNHDLKFTDDPAVKGEPIGPVRPEYRQAYEQFYSQMFFLPPNEFLTCGRRFLLARAVPVEVACLNSSALQQIPGAFQGHGFLGERQLDSIAEGMGWTDGDVSPRPFRILAMHHHLLPITYRELPIADHPYSVVLDAEALMRRVVKYRVDLVIHGHMHHPAFASVSHPIDHEDPNAGAWRFSVAAMGSTGVAAQKLGEVRKNVFGLLDFDDRGATLSVRSLHPTNDSTQQWSVNVPRGRLEEAPAHH